MNKQICFIKNNKKENNNNKKNEFRSEQSNLDLNGPSNDNWDE